jgi:hypothetical protein
MAVRRWSVPISARVWYFALLLLPFAETYSFAQTVKIRLVNTVHGSPVKDRRISIFGINGNIGTLEKHPQEMLAKNAVPDLRLVSSVNGEAALELPRPAPPYFYVLAELRGPVWDCPCLVRVFTEDVLHKGLVISNAADQRTPGEFQTHPTPGEILFRLKPLPWWVHILWPVVKD